MLKMLDLFSGIGGFSLAASWTGEIETVAFCEIDKYATKVLNKNFPGIPVEPDIRELRNESQYGTIDIISGGFPCQPFSVAGKRRGKDDNRDLWPEMFRVIKEFRPTWVVGENVAGFVNMELERTVIDLEAEGYEVQSFIIPACGIDAKHERKRVWIVAYSPSMQRNAGAKEQRKFRPMYENWIELHYADRSSQVLADPDSMRMEGARPKQQTARISRKSEILANNERKRLEGENGPKQKSRNITGCSSEKGKPSEWPIEPGILRVANGIPSRVDRIKCLGNAIVPQVVYPIFQCIVTLENIGIKKI